MSFFKDLKDGVPEETPAESENIEVNGENNNADDELFNVEEILDSELSESYDEEIVEGQPEEELPDSELLDTILADNSITEEPAATHKSVSDEDKNATTVITRGTTINGSIISDCSLDVMGTINGDIECIGKLSISGNVVGNSIASEVFVNTKRLEGGIDSEGSVKVALGTVIVGDIKAGSAVIAGAVKGELDVAGPVVLDSTAIIKGNVKAKSVQMNNGAILEGFCSLTYSDVNIDDVFE